MAWLCERSDIIHPPRADIKFVLMEDNSENSIMCSVWFDRNAVICPHVIKIKFMLLSDLAVCKPLLMLMKPQFWAKNMLLLLLLLLWEKRRERGASGRLLGQKAAGIVLVWVTITRKDIGRLFCKAYHCKFWENFILSWCVGIMGRCVRTGSASLFLLCICSMSQLSEVFVCEQGLI